MPNLKFLTLTVTQIWRGSQNSKSRSRDLFTTCKYGVAGDTIFGFFDPDLPIHYTTFMGVRWRLMVVYRWASPLLRPFLPIFGPICSWVTWSVNRGLPLTPYLDYPTPICLDSLYNFHDTAIKIKGSLLMSITIVKQFWPKILRPLLGPNFDIFGQSRV